LNENERICKEYATKARQITMPVHHNSVFYRPDAVPDAKSTISEALKATGC